MARRKREPGGGGARRRRPEAPLDPVLNRRALEGVMQQMIAERHGQGGPETPLGRAQQIMYGAWKERDEKVQARMAREALALSPDCADAYVLLAEQSPGRKEALRLYEQGVAAGERALGAEKFAREAGRFWGLLETRPYMRARLGLALALWNAGRRDEAVGHMQEMLRLNPGDNQGVRYTLAGWLLFLDRDDEVARLLERFGGDDLAAWAYTRALLAFRRQGDTAEAHRWLRKALKSNKHVPAYLTGEKFPPIETPGSFTPGDENEALDYIANSLAPWKFTPGAVAWLRANWGGKKPKAGPAPQGPLGLVKKWLLKNLPQEYDVWQADCRQMPGWIKIADRPVRPWLVLVTSRSNDLALAHEMSEEAPPAALLWDALVKAMRQPAAGAAHRPTELQVLAGERGESLRPHLEEIGVSLEVAEELDQLEDVFRGMWEHFYGPPGPSLLGMPGVTPERAGAFFEAAAIYYRQAPWKVVGDEAAIEVRCASRQSGPWYAVPMGQSGLTLGLALYEDLAALRRQWAGGRSDRENARDFVATSVTFEEPWDIPVPDLEAVGRYGWEVARPDAYPSVFHKERGLSSRPPLAWELELMEACLRAVPEFVKRRKPDDPGREEMTVRAGEGELTLGLGWVVEEG